jgi:hypothetical protein
VVPNIDRCSGLLIHGLTDRLASEFHTPSISVRSSSIPVAVCGAEGIHGTWPLVGLEVDDRLKIDLGAGSAFSFHRPLDLSTGEAGPCIGGRATGVAKWTMRHIRRPARVVRCAQAMSPECGHNATSCRPSLGRVVSSAIKDPDAGPRADIRRTQ